MIETERLILRPFDTTDTDIILRLYGDAETMRYMPSPVLNAQTAEEHLNTVMALWTKTPRVRYEMAILLRQTGEKIGRAEITRNCAEESAMIGWMLVTNARGNGYAAETAGALIRYCFETLPVRRVYALCHPENAASRAVMEKIGMRPEAHYIKKCRYTKAEGTRWEDELEYALLKEEFSPSER